MDYFTVNFSLFTVISIPFPNQCIYCIRSHLFYSIIYWIYLVTGKFSGQEMKKYEDLILIGFSCAIFVLLALLYFFLKAYGII